VLQAFAGCREIYYTAVGYVSDRGDSPAYAQPPDVLVREAPSVHVARDFRGRTMTAVLGVTVEKLMRVRDDAAAASLPEPLGASPTTAEWDVDSLALEAEAAADRLDGEDGYGQTAAVEDTYDDGYPSLEADEGELRDSDEEEGTLAAAPLPQPLEAASSDGYQDGFEGAVTEAAFGGPLASSYGDEAEAAEDVASAQASAFPSGSVPPAMLEDEDEQTKYADDGHPGVYGEPYELPPYQPLELPPPQDLTPQDQVRILRLIAREFESGPDGYSAINADGEFKGLFPNHPAIGRWHVGLSWGFVQFTQDSGALGQVLSAMHQRDAAAFRRTFGDGSDQLLSVTNAPGPTSRQRPPRGARVQPVGGQDLWDEPWLARFRAAGAHPPFQAAQNEVAARIYIEPIRSFARALGLDSQRALAMVVDRAVQQGPAGARRWIVEAAGPLGTEALYQSALRALGHSDLRSFQRAAGLGDDGDWGPDTHVAMVAALRALPEGTSGVPIPSREQMLDSLVRQASAQRRPWAHRLPKLRSTAELSDDVVYRL
jgi:hypothetical protein